MKPNEALLQRLKDELKLDLCNHIVIRRIYAGRNQRCAGAARWFLHKPYTCRCYDNKGFKSILSWDKVTELLKAKTLILEYDHVTHDFEITMSKEDEQKQREKRKMRSAI